MNSNSNYINDNNKFMFFVVVFMGVGCLFYVTEEEEEKRVCRTFTAAPAMCPCPCVYFSFQKLIREKNGNIFNLSFFLSPFQYFTATSQGIFIPNILIDSSQCLADTRVKLEREKWWKKNLHIWWTSFFNFRVR